MKICPWHFQRLDRYTGRFCSTHFPSNDDAASQDNLVEGANGSPEKSFWLDRSAGQRGFPDETSSNKAHGETTSASVGIDYKALPCQLINNKCTPVPQTESFKGLGNPVVSKREEIFASRGSNRESGKPTGDADAGEMFCQT